MRSAQRRLFFFSAAACLFVMASQTRIRAQAGGSNLTKEVMDKKGAIVWKAVPATAIPQDVCNALGVCTGPIKLIVLPKATEGGTVVARGLYLTQDAKHADVVVLERQALGQDTYFFLLSGDGNLAKAEYAQVTSTSWQLMGNTVSQPTFQKETAAWQKGLAKLGAAPAPAPAAGAAPAQ